MSWAPALTKVSGHYIRVLIILDHATQYLEAVALRNTMAPLLARELATIFSRVGFPQEILTNQGTNFMEQVMQQFWWAIGV